MSLWTAQPLYQGRTVAIAAGGPSFSLSQARMLGIARAKDLLRVIAVNDAVYPCWFADVAYACDAAWWRYHSGLPGFSGRRLSLDESGVPGVDYLKNTGFEGLESDPSGLKTGGNSGYQVLNLCAHLRAERVILLGYDMRGDNHWFGAHPEPVRRSAPNMTTRLRRFAELKVELDRIGIRVINASPGSALTDFPAGDLEREIQMLEKRNGQKAAAP